MSRHAQLLVEPLAGWPYPPVPTVASPFRTRDRDLNGRQYGPQKPVPWSTTRDELLREADHLGAKVVVLELDCSRDQLRQDGEIRANARLHSGKVRISMDTRHGSMRWALARYDEAGLSWAANVRGIVLTLEALRAVDRYGAVADGQQYAGFLAIEAAPAAPFTDADSAERWIRSRLAAQDPPLREVVRRAQRVMHPDAMGGERGDWDVLERAVELMRAGALL